MPRKLIRMITVGISVGVVLGTAVLVIQSRGARTSRTAITPETITVQQSVSYIAITDDQMIDSADFIFRGSVADISRTRWNQDSGEAWDDGVLLHEIRIDVQQPPIVSTIDSPKQVTVTVLGSSPLDGHADHDLKVGDEAVFFVRQADFAWRNGSRRILQLLGDPMGAYLRKGPDGRYGNGVDLEDLISKIANRRDVLVAEP